jgi:hypothetical protein
MQSKLLQRDIKDETDKIQKDVEVLSLTELLYRSNERLRKWRESKRNFTKE